MNAATKNEKKEQHYRLILPSHFLLSNESARSSYSSIDSACYNDEFGASLDADAVTLVALDTNTSKLTRKSAFLQCILSILRELSLPYLDSEGSLPSIFWGLLYLSFGGIMLGLLMPKNMDLPTLTYRVASSVIGYTYTIFWCGSFYPQVVLNFKRKSTEGLSNDFSVINFVGFLCYATYVCCFYWSEGVQQMYRERHQELTPENELKPASNAKITVQSNDVAFALHSVILSAVLLMQVAWYRRPLDDFSSPHGHSSISVPVMMFILAVFSFVLTYAFLVKVVHEGTAKENVWIANISWDYLNWLDFLYFLSMIKVIITIIKYIPQVALNAR